MPTGSLPNCPHPGSAPPFPWLEEPLEWRHSGGKIRLCWGDGAPPHPLLSSQKLRAGAHAKRLLWGTRRCSVTLLSLLTCCLALDTPSLCPCAQQKGFSGCLHRLFYLLTSLPTPKEQPDSSSSSGAAVRANSSAWTGSQHLHSLQGTSFDAPDRYLRQDSTYTLHYLSDRDGKGVIRKRGGVGSALLTLVGKKWVWRLLGGLGEAVVAGPGSLIGASASSAQQQGQKWPRALLSTSHHAAGAKGLLCLPKWEKSCNKETQPSSVCQEKREKSWDWDEGCCLVLQDMDLVSAPCLTVQRACPLVLSIQSLSLLKKKGSNHLFIIQPMEEPGKLCFIPLSCSW